jgi:phage shock protein A
MSDFRSRVQPCFKELGQSIGSPYPTPLIRHVHSDNLRDKLQKRKDDFAVLRSERDNLLKLVNTSASLAQEALEKKTSAEQQVERLRQERDEARQKCDEAQAGWRLAEKELTKVGDWDVLQAEVSQYKQASEQNKLSVSYSSSMFGVGFISPMA